ncbi:hypothetical protein GE061_011024 [Apolygus lucorum]|uniref:Uncharacterized protein n=1 Tax=Apolygus lucorum TaxID=248454 RepID=A0A8S9XYY4_APOLU|nr:hypothetical protein GE061_011024 [Apolygus lucorum]
MAQLSGAILVLCLVACAVSFEIGLPKGPRFGLHREKSFAQSGGPPSGTPPSGTPPSGTPPSGPPPGWPTHPQQGSQHQRGPSPIRNYRDLRALKHKKGVQSPSGTIEISEPCHGESFVYNMFMAYPPSTKALNTIRAHRPSGPSTLWNWKAFNPSRALRTPLAAEDNLRNGGGGDLPAPQFYSGRDTESIPRPRVPLAVSSSHGVSDLIVFSVPIFDLSRKKIKKFPPFLWIAFSGS